MWSKSLPEWTSNTASGYAYYNSKIDQPDLDTREYRVLQLDNGIRIVLVHDSKADKAAACNAVAVGHLRDPDDVPGMAHFCEHMITKGSEPYPSESDYHAFISSNGGARNAGTSASYTDYWFSIAPGVLSHGLPRLAAFYHSPLFTSNLAAREMNAIDSENKRNLQNDSRRLFQLKKSLSREDSDWRKFGTGNLASLTEAARRETGDEDTEKIANAVRNKLVEWWEREYCASRMALAVIGKESLDELADLAIPLFSRVPNRGIEPRPKLTNPVWGTEQMGTVVFMKTIKDYHAFSITWQIPDQSAHYLTRPASCIAHFLGHEGPGSVCALLKKHGWILQLYAGPNDRVRGVHNMVVEGRLTKEGYLHSREVILTIFNYISLLLSSLDKLPSYHHDEIARMSSTGFRFRLPTQPHVYVRSLALDLLEPYPPELLLSRGALRREWDGQKVREVLELMTIEQSRVVLEAREHDNTTVNSLTSEQDGEDSKIEWDNEKWYSTEYCVLRLSNSMIKEAKESPVNKELFLPSPNPYIPENLDVMRDEVDKPIPYPLQVRQTPLSTLYHKKDDQFWAPKGYFKLFIKSRLAYASPRHAVLTRLFIDLLEDVLAAPTYAAQLAGLSYSISYNENGLKVSVDGYNDKLHVLLDFVLKELIECQIDPARLTVFADELERCYKNFYLGQPSNLSDHFTSAALSPVTWSPEEKLAEIRAISARDIQRHRDELLLMLQVDVLAVGNIHKEHAVEIIELVEKRLKCRALPPAQWPRTRSLLLPPGSNLVLCKTHANAKEMNSALTFYLQLGDLADARIRAIAQLIVHMIKEPVYSQLRTEQQLGYVVAASLWASTGSVGLGIKIQSLRSPIFLESRVEAFLTKYRNTMAELSEEEWGFQKAGLITKLREKPKNLGEEAARFWYYIESGYLDFLRSESDADTVQRLTKDEVLLVYEQLVVQSSPSRKKLALHMLSQQLKEELELPGGTTVVEDEALFKASLLCSAAAVPVRSHAVHNPSECVTAKTEGSRL